MDLDLPTRSPEALVQELISRVFNCHDLDAADGLISENYIQHSPDVPTGRDGFKGYFAEMFATFPDFRYVVRRIVADGPLVAVLATQHFTLIAREFAKPDQAHKVSMQTADFFRVDEGLIQEHWDVVDRLQAWIAIGLVSPSTGVQHDLSI